MVLKKYVPGITHHQLCTVANWNPQLSKDFLLSLGNSPQKHKKKISVISGCDAAALLFDPSCPPLHPPQRSSKLLRTGNRSALYKYTVWHSKFILAHIRWHLWHAMSPQTVTIGHLLGRGFNASLFPYNKDSVSRHEVCTYCCVDGLFRLCSHSRKDRYGELHLILCIINSPTLRSSWTEASSAQRERPTFAKVFRL